MPSLPSWGECVKDIAEAKGVATLQCLPILFQNVIRGALLFAGIAAILFIIYSGFKYINSGGDPKQLEGARHTLMYALLGLTLILFSFLIINLISSITGVSCIKTFGFGCS